MSRWGPDLKSWQTWTELAVPVERLGPDNWWSNGPTGPCGPDSELFVWTGDEPPRGTPGTEGRWMELWNHVTMSYLRYDDGSLEPLPQHNVDTGMGLERLLMAIQRQPSVFDCDIFEPWTTALTGLWQPDRRSLRLLADHLRSSIVIVGDGITPSNTGRGYVLRRLLRRALTTLWRPDHTRTLDDLPASLVEQTLAQFGQHEGRPNPRGAPRRGTPVRPPATRSRAVLDRLGPDRPLTEADLRYLHQTHGLPAELIAELLD
jgi:alanyl-tRNA synthetase